MSRRIASAVVSVLLTAASCSTNDAATAPVPTVPTAAPTAPEGSDEPDSNEPQPTAPDAPDPPDTAPDAPDAPDDDPDHLTPTTVTIPPAGDLGAVRVQLREIASLNEPIAMTTVPGDTHLWIAERPGTIVRLNPTTGEIADTVLDISDATRAAGERGLLGIASDETHLYINYTDTVGDTQVESYALTDGGVDPGSRRRLLFQGQPFGNHNGGGLVIDDAGDLYVGFGDGGSGGDPLGAGQDRFSWLGSILRIDPTPDAAEPYAIPSDNPYADGVDGLPEIYLIGVRNPWRFSFDSATGDLWIGDVGQNRWEEVTLLLAANGAGVGANLGWNLREGLHEFAGPEPEDHADPVWEYGHDEGVSVTGGYVYRGAEVPELYGNYIFGDFATGRLWGLGIRAGEVVFRDFDTPVPGGQLASFGEGPDGEIFTLSLAGPVSRLIPE